MSSVFVSDTGGFSQSNSQKPAEPARPKRPRPSLACIRCRKKKVKCDFVQPTCGRCANAGLPCSYATPPRRVDGQAFDQLGNHVEELKERMQKMQTELALIKSNLHPFSSTGGNEGFGASGSSVGTGTGIQAIDDDNSMCSPRLMSPLGNSPTVFDQLAVTHDRGLGALSSSPTPSMAPGGEPQQPVTWKLSLSPSGLRIDTNIASVADLYRILLNGISQLNINSDSTTNLFSTDSIRSDTSKPRQHKAWGRYAQRTAKPVDVGSGPSAAPGGSIGTSEDGSNNHLQQQLPLASNGGKLWEVDENEARKIIQERQSTNDTIPQKTLDNLMHTCYHKCFLSYQIVDKDAFMQEYTSTVGLNPLLANSISAWVAKHGCVYHDACPGQDPSTMGEAYFKNARQLLKKCFDISNATTVHALLNLYMYQLSSERSSLAYLYIGLAIRMAQDLKFHKKEHMPADPKQRETNKRLWWSAYWLDLCAALESNRPTMVDDKDCDLEYPIKLDSEDEETGYRIDFCVHSIKLMKIRKDIMKHLPSEQSGQSLLSAISRLENALTNWLTELPQYLHFEPENVFHKSGNFSDEATLILNIQYQTTWIMLHKFFLPKQNQTATPVALLSLNICTKSANLITKMLDIYAKNVSWCQFFYALDGVIASVGIHQSNALSEENDVALLAQRNLILTANILRGSPLLYMEKVNEIIESIETFLKQNGLPTDLNKLPAVNEDLVNQQSIYSVFHPAVFENQSGQQQQQQQQPQQRTGSVRSTTPAPATPSQSVTSMSASLPSRVPPTIMSSTPHSQQTTLASPQPSPQQRMPDQQQPVQQPPTSMTAAQHMALGYNNQSHIHSSGNMMSTQNMLFNNAALMGFTAAPPGGQASMDQMFLRDMTFAVDHSAGVSGEGLNQSDVFASMGSSMLGGTPFTSNATSNAGFPFADLSQAANVYNTQLRTDDGSHGPGGNVTAATTETFTNPSLFDNHDTMFGLDNHHHHPHHQQHAQPFSDSAFDPAAATLFSDIDQAAMNALLYGSANAPMTSAGAGGIPQMGFGQQGMQQHQQQSTQANLAAAMYAAAASRKRAQRDWDESA